MKRYIYIVGGVILGCLVTYFIMKQLQTNSSTNESHVIAYEIKKLNKLIVAEQMFSDVYSHQNSRYIPGLQNFFSFDKKAILLVNAKVQATYDLKKLEVEIDSTQKVVRILEVPNVEIEVYPEVKFFDLEQSRFNSFEKDELNELQDRAIAHIKKTIDKSKLEKEAHQQLIQNLGEIYQIAKLYNWKIEDKTPFAKELEIKFK